MRTFLSAILGVIAVGVLLIAYGVFNPRAATADQYQVARPGVERVGLLDESVAGTPHLQIRCEPGQLAVIRQVGGASAAECVDDDAAGYGARATRASLVYPESDVRPVRTVQRVRYQSAPAPRRAATRVDRGRDWQKTALIIGGSSAAGAGIGGLIGGKKGALIGAAIGGGASSLYAVKNP